MTVSLAKAFAGQGVTVNTVSPGIIVTESIEAYFRTVATDRGFPQEWSEIERRVIANFCRTQPVDSAGLPTSPTSSR